MGHSIMHIYQIACIQKCWQSVAESRVEHVCVLASSDVPYSLRGKVEEELECLEKEGITEPVQFAESFISF